MASKTSKGTSSGYPANTSGAKPGPTSSQGYGATALPPNPSDAIQAGSPLPLMQPQYQTLRRPFNEVTKSPLHYNDGPGTDECVTSRRPLPASANEPFELDHHDYAGHSFGTDPHKYSDGENNEHTLNGVEIYGT